MKQDFFAVLDIGSSKITCMAANSIAGGEFVIRAVGQAEYDGFDSNGWYEPDKVGDSIRSAIEQVQAKTQSRIKKLIVGVPANFCYLSLGEASVGYRDKKRITVADAQDVCQRANSFDNNEQRKYISCSPLYYYLDGTIKVFDPVGAQAQRLSVVVSVSFMNTQFERTVMDALNRLGIKNIQFANTAELQSKFVSRTNSVNGYAIVIDVGYITISVMLTCSRGLMFVKSFALGRGYIASDLHSVLDISYNQSLELLDKIRLNLELRADDAYSLNNGVNVDAIKANEIVKARIEQFANYIIRCFDACDVEIPAATPVILTGGGITYLRGAADCLSEFLGKEVQVYSSNNPQTNRNEYTSTYGLLQFGVEQENNKPNNYSLLNLWKKFRGGK